MAQWRCRINGRETGPFSDEQLRAKAAAGELKPSDKVYNAANGQWQPAIRLRGLFTPSAVAPALDPAGAPPALSVVAGDVGPFLKVAASYSFSANDRWGGAVYAAPMAFYLVKAHRHSLGHHFGLIGIALWAAMERPDDLRSCRISELPEPVRGQLTGWFKADHDVIVLPKSAIHYIDRTWSGRLRIDCGQDRFHLSRPFFRSGRVKRFLEENSWVLNHRMDVTSAPVHGRSVGRRGTDPGPATPNVWQRLAYAAIAVIVAMGAMWLKSNRSPDPAPPDWPPHAHVAGGPYADTSTPGR